METDSSALLFLVLEPTALTSLPDVVVSVFALHTKCCRVFYNCSNSDFQRYLN